MRRFCQLIGRSISMRTLLTQRIRGVLAHQTQVFPQGPISFANNAYSRVQWKPFPGILPVAPGAGQQARILLCLNKTVPNTEFPPPTPRTWVSGKQRETQAAMFVSKYFCIVYILYIFVVTYYLNTDSIKDFFLKPSVTREVTWRASTGSLFHLCVGWGGGRRWTAVALGPWCTDITALGVGAWCWCFWLGGS